MTALRRLWTRLPSFIFSKTPTGESEGIYNLTFQLLHGVSVSQFTFMEANLNIVKDFSSSMEQFLRSATFAVSSGIHHLEECVNHVHSTEGYFLAFYGFCLLY